jgi:mono/diheme cytochrome c family protein
MLALLPLTQGVAFAQTADGEAGRTLWESSSTMCRNCHGAKGEGGLGPDLAGRRLTVPQFTRAVRKPWGIMPAFIESQMSDKELTDLVAYFDSLPPNAEPGPWRFTPASGAPRGQQVALAMGCAQCHGPTFNVLRQGAGSVNGDFEWFKKSVYEHTTEQPKL